MAAGWLPCWWMAFESLGLFEHRISGFFGRGKIGRHNSFWKHILKASVFFFEVEKWNIAQNRRS